MNIGLRIDADTYRGTRLGVPALLRELDRHSLRASFFFSVGPDNMGRHLWRLWRPAFLAKLVRTNAPGLYGWDILLRGLLWPGPLIGRGLAPVIRSARDAGHEIGLHAWDHHAWQANIGSMGAAAVRLHLERAHAALAGIAGAPPSCSAAPGWRCTDVALAEKDRFDFRYNSDCRGTAAFRPVAGGRVLAQPQVPVTLPTFDEAVGRGGVTAGTFNAFVEARLRPAGLNVLCVHAESEGLRHLPLFRDFLDRAKSLGGRVGPLSDGLPPVGALPRGTLARGTVPGREGWVSCQAPE